MTPEMRLECLKLASGNFGTAEDIVDRARKYEEYVDGMTTIEPPKPDAAATPAVERAMRAKVRITGISGGGYGGGGQPGGSFEELKFAFPAKDGAYPSDGSDEDQQFARFSPSGQLALTIMNPNLVGKFKVGDTFYLDFIPVAKPTTAG